MKLRKSLCTLALALVLALILPLSAAAAEPAGGQYSPPPYDPLPYAIYIFDPESLLYYYMADYWTEPYASAIDWVLDTLAPVETPAGPPEGGVMTISNDGAYTKKQYILRGGAMEIDGKAYAMDPADYAAMKEACAAVSEKPGFFALRNAIPYWLLYQNPNRVTSVCHINEDGVDCAVNPAEILNAAHLMRSLACVRGGSYKPGSVDFTGMAEVVYTFDSGATYTLAMKGDRLYIEASDMSYACWYDAEIQDSLQVFQEAITEMSYITPEPVAPDDFYGVPADTGKPVIYLYPEEPTDVEVKLDFAGTLSYTFPEYDNGWRVTAQPDGTLTNKADGSAHYYLFWEGTADKKDWDFSSGFVVKGSEAGAFLLETLPRLGLTPREYNDFITYWTPELARNEWNLLNFNIEEYEAVAPLTVTPAPDTILRVHMVWKPVDEPVNLPRQVLPPAPERDGFTLVEWGGTRAYRG